MTTEEALFYQLETESVCRLCLDDHVEVIINTRQAILSLCRKCTSIYFEYEMAYKNQDMTDIAFGNSPVFDPNIIRLWNAGFAAGEAARVEHGRNECPKSHHLIMEDTEDKLEYLVCTVCGHAFFGLVMGFPDAFDPLMYGERLKELMAGAV